MTRARKKGGTKPVPAPQQSPDHWRDPPCFLTDEARIWWTPTVELLRTRGRLPHVMPLSVWKFCQFLDQFLRVTKILNAEGQILDIRDDKGVLKKSMPDPAFTVQAKLFDQLRRLVAELGLEDRPGRSPHPPAHHSPPLRSGQTQTDQTAQDDGDRQAVLRRALQGFSLDRAGRG